MLPRFLEDGKPVVIHFKLFIQENVRSQQYINFKLNAENMFPPMP